jgi:hypothetical protein
MRLKEQFRSTPKRCEALNTFLQSATGRDLMEVLHEAARPKKSQDAKQMASGQDFVMQLALNHASRLAQYEMIELIKDCSEPSKTITKPPVKPEESMELEPEEEETPPPVEEPSNRKKKKS